MEDIKGRELKVGQRVIAWCDQGFLVEGEVLEIHRFNADRSLRMEQLVIVKNEYDEEFKDDYDTLDDWEIESSGEKFFIINN